jgi:hypothetical protein
MLSFKKWWREGEEPGSHVYRSPWWRPLPVAAVILLLYWLAPPMRAWYVDLISALGMARACCERRRAIILTESSLTVRSVFSRPKRIALADIVAVKRLGVAVSVLLSPRQVVGARLTLRDGSTVDIPLDLPRSRAVADRLIAACGPPNREA